MQDFLPVTKKEMKQRGWEQVDFAYITGDAYVDHPSFGTAIISRLLESRGYKVGIIPQPDWRKKESSMKQELLLSLLLLQENSSMLPTETQTEKIMVLIISPLRTATKQQ